MSNDISLLFYLSCFSVSAILFFISIKRKSAILTILALLIPVMVAGLRLDVGTDYKAYVSIFESISKLSFNEFMIKNTYNVETSFYILSKISYTLTNGPVLLFTISSAISIFFFYFGLRKYNTKHKSLIYFLYLLIIFPVTLNAVRQGIAMSICFYAFTFIYDKKLIRFILLMLFACIFHASAMFMLPFYLIRNIAKPAFNKPTYILTIRIILIALLFYLAIPTLLGILANLPMFEKYNKLQIIASESNNYTFYLKSVIILIILAFSRKIISINKNYIYVIAFAIFDISLSSLGFTLIEISRISLYLSFYILILLTGLIDVFNNKYGKFLPYVILILYGFAYFYLAYYTLGQSDIFPYQFNKEIL